MRLNFPLVALGGRRCDPRMSSCVRFYRRLAAASVPAALVFFLLCFSYVPAVAGELPALDGHLSVLTDESGRLQLDDVLKKEWQSKFAPLPGKTANMGYTRKVYWLKFEVLGTEETDALLSMAPNFLNFIDAHISYPGHHDRADQFQHFSFGDHRTLQRDGLSPIAPAVKIPLLPGRATYVYVRLHNESSFTQISMKLEPLESIGVRRLAEGLALGLWFGGMSILLLTQLVFYYFDRKVGYILLAVSTLNVILVYLGNLGLSTVFIFPGNGFWNDRFLGVNAWAGLTAHALAYAHILDIPRREKAFYPIFLAVAVIGVIGVGFALFGQTIMFGPYGSVTSILGALMTMALGWRQVNQNDRASKLTAIACTLVGLGSSIGIMQRMGASWLPEWTFNIYGIMALLQVLFFTGAVASRLRAAETLNLAMQAQALRMAQEAEHAATRLVEERTRELVVARKRAEEALQSEMESQLRQVRFLEVVSHQYRTPLASVRSNIDAMAVTLENIDQANLTRISRIRRAVARLAEILEVNLSRSRLQGASYRPKLAKVAIGVVVASALQRTRDLLNDPQLIVDTPDEVAAVTLAADADMLALAIVNLLENALKYSPPDAQSSICLSLRHIKNEIVVEVRDHGIGIPAGDLPHIFENARRGANAGTIEGSGLGLFLVEKICVAHSGRVEVQSNEGQGTTISMILPIAMAP